MDDAHWPSGVARLDFDRIDSTNAEAKRQAAAGRRGPVWIVAREQTAGRGRNGRQWRSSGDDLAATLLFYPADFRPETTIAEVATLSFAASLAVADAVFAVAPQADVALKWPNDVLLEGRKIAGVLLEAEGQGADAWLAIGVGVNVATTPPFEAIEPDAVSPIALQAVAPKVDRDAMLIGLAAALAQRLADWSTAGFAALRGPWLARAARLGETIEVRRGRQRLSGRFADVDPTGALVLETGDETHTVAAADVFFP